MANIWPVYMGRRPTLGQPWGSMPWREAIERFELEPGGLLSPLDRTPRFDSSGNLTGIDGDLSAYGYRCVVVELDDPEAERGGWTRGFYRSRVSARDGYHRLLAHAAELVLGRKSVTRVELKERMDSENLPSFMITVVLTPEARARITNRDMSMIFGELSEQLHVMGSEGTPHTHYTTEAELAQNEA